MPNRTFLITLSIWLLPWATGTLRMMFIVPMWVTLLVLYRLNRRTTRKLSASIAVFLVFLTLADFAARPLLKPLLYPRPVDELSVASPAYGAFPQYPANAEIQRTQLEYGTPYPVVFRTDGNGFRNDETPVLNNPPLKYIVLGDSIAAGVGVSQEDVFSVQLAEQINTPVYNLSVSATAPPAQYILARDTLPKLPVDDNTVIIWTLFTGNDLTETNIRENPNDPLVGLQPASPSEQRYTRLQSFRNRSPFWQLVLRVYYAALRQAYPIFQTTQFVELDDGTNMSIHTDYINTSFHTLQRFQENGQARDVEEAFAAVRGLADEYGICTIVVTIPTKEFVYAPLSAELVDVAALEQLDSDLFLQQMSEKYDMPFFSLHSTLREQAIAIYETEDVFIWLEHDLTHPNARGHQIIADEIAGILTNEAPCQAV